jgi:hypothetical protein
MEVSGKLHSQATLTTAKEHLVTTGQEPVWALKLVWMIWRGEKSSSYQDSNSDPSATHHIAILYTDCATKQNITDKCNNECNLPYYIKSLVEIEM